jgi:hypothetical protein
MTDNELIQLFVPVITAGLSSNGFPDVIVQSLYEPTQQGINSGATIYYYKLPDERIGFVGRTDVYNEEVGNFTHTETQWYESTFQISCLFDQNPQSLSYTASDLVNLVASIMQSDIAVNTLNAAGVGILRVQRVENTPFVDDRDEYEYNPSFDFTLTYTRDIITTTPIVTLPIETFVQPI